MKLLKNYEKEIQRCSKCGLCTVACPEFQKTGNECFSLKGKMIILQGILDGKLCFNEKIYSYMKICSDCKKCFNCCPAGINFEEIINSALNVTNKDPF